MFYSKYSSRLLLITGTTKCRLECVKCLKCEYFHKFKNGFKVDKDKTISGIFVHTRRIPYSHS